METIFEWIELMGHLKWMYTVYYGWFLGVDEVNLVESICHREDTMKSNVSIIFAT